MQANFLLGLVVVGNGSEGDGNSILFLYYYSIPHPKSTHISLGWVAQVSRAPSRYAKAAGVISSHGTDKK